MPAPLSGGTDRPALPLSDIRVVAVEQHGSGPFASLQLADLGAEVIKVENPRNGGDVTRHLDPFGRQGDSLFFQSLNRNKRSVALDLTTDGGQRALHALVARSDAVLANLRPDMLDRLGLRYAQLEPANPMIVCCLLTGFGLTGPRRLQPAYDIIVQALAGWMAQTGDPDGEPVRTGLSLVDFCGGYVAALGLLSGVHAARRAGKGLECDLSMFDSAVSLLSYFATWQLSLGHDAPRRERSAHATVAPFQLYRAQDGWLVVGAVKEAAWRRLTEALDLPHLVTDPRFADREARRVHRAELERELERVLVQESVEHWLKELTAADVPCADVRSVGDALDDEQVRARGMTAAFDHPVLGEVRTVRSPYNVGPARSTPRGCAALGAETESVLSEVAGMSGDDIATLRAGGAFGEPAPEQRGST